MEWIDDLNDVMTYIEKHLTDEISYDELAKLAHCSTYHFQRMFSYMAGVPLSEYIRRRRMSLAAVDLQTTDMKVIDIALKYGYNSPTAFNRAFKNIHHISPSETRNNVVVLSSFPPLEFTLSIKGVEKMNYVLLVFQKRYLKLLKKTLKSCQKFGISLLVKESLLN